MSSIRPSLWVIYQSCLILILFGGDTLLPVPPSSVRNAGWSFLFCCNMRLDCGGGGRGQQGLGNGTEHCVSELAEVLWASQLVPCARAKGKFVFSCLKLRILSAVTGLGAKGLGMTSVKVTSASCLTREGLHGCSLYVCGGVASHWACPDS